NHLPFMRIDAIAFFERDVANMRHLIGMLFMRKPIDFLAAVRDEQLAPRRCHITTTKLLEYAKLIRMLTEPYQIAVSLVEQAFELGIVREFFDCHRRAHIWM